MEKIDEQLKNIALAEFPAEMHQSIMRAVDYRRIRPVLLVGFFLLASIFVLTAWHINIKLVNAEFSDMMKDFFGSFELSFYFVGTVLGSFFEIISPTLVLSGILSLVGTIYLGKKIKTFEFSKTKTALFS